jgi:hypothetical protein
MPAGVPVTQLHRGQFAESRYWGRWAIWVFKFTIRHRSHFYDEKLQRWFREFRSLLG